MAPLASQAPFHGGFEEGGLLAPWSDPINQDNISASVAITRDYYGGIFNALEEGDSSNSYRAPSGTRWALLPPGKSFEEARCDLRFCSWLECFAQYDAPSMVGKPGILYLVKENEYYNIEFTNWTTNRGDSYEFKSLKQQTDKTDSTQSRNAARNRRLQYQDEGPPVRAPVYPPAHYDDDYDLCYYKDDYWNCDDSKTDYDFGELGGGFQYVRDEFPIVYDNSTECPRCCNARASPSELDGSLDETFVEVEIEGVTPDDVEITILAIAQESSPKCNRGVFNGTDQVRPNGKGVGNSTAFLRRTLPVGSITPMRYTVHYMATNEAGTCRSSVEVCSPPEGLKCDDDIYGFDATSTRYCDG